MSTTFLNANNIWKETCHFPENSISPDSVVLCVNLDDIFCNLKSYNENKSKRGVGKGGEIKCIASTLAVISPYSVGYSKAPYYGPGKPTPDSQMLSKITADNKHRNLWMQSFMKDKNTKFRGPVCPELQAVVPEGCALRFLVTEHTFGFEDEKSSTQKRLFPAVDVIPAFSTLLVSLRVRNQLKAEEGELLKISCIEFAHRGLNAFLPVLDRLPTALDAQNVINERCREMKAGQNLFAKSGEFFVEQKVSQSAVFQVDDNARVIKVFGWQNGQGGDEVQQVDMDFDTVRRYLNFGCMQKAKRLLEIASCLGCVTFFVGKNRMYTRNGTSENVVGLSMYRCIPVIRFHAMFGMEDVSGENLVTVIDRINRSREESDVPFQCMLYNDYVVEYDPTVQCVMVNTGKFYTYEHEKTRVSRAIKFRFDLRVFIDACADEMALDGLNTDTQIYHKSMKVHKYSRIHVDLGQDSAEGQEKLDYVCLIMDVNSCNVQSTSCMVPQKRKSVEDEDDDGFDD